jgi:hypothetical protein
VKYSMHCLNKVFSQVFPSSYEVKGQSQMEPWCGSSGCTVAS